MEKIVVKLPYIDQTIYVGESLLETVVKQISALDYDHIFMVVDSKVHSTRQHYLQHLCQKLNINNKDVIVLKPEPESKNFNQAETIIRHLLHNEASRKSCLLAIGGGYIGDLTGFVAAVYKRGIDFAQISTTFMGMVDAVIGKVAINFDNVKNLLGAFYSPKLVFCDISFLSDLDNKEINYGLVEVWKHALLVNDHQILAEIDSYLSNGTKLPLQSMITFSLNVKKGFVEKDSNDTRDLHKALSLGHTLANYLEHEAWVRHGMAVFYGIVLAAIMSYNLQEISPEQYEGIIHTARLFETKIQSYQKICALLQNPQIVIKALSQDKINHHRSLSYVLLSGNGFCVKKNIPPDEIREAINQFSTLEL